MDVWLWVLGIAVTAIYGLLAFISSSYRARFEKLEEAQHRDHERLIRVETKQEQETSEVKGLRDKWHQLVNDTNVMIAGWFQRFVERERERDREHRDREK